MSGIEFRGRRRFRDSDATERRARRCARSARAGIPTRPPASREAGPRRTVCSAGRGGVLVGRVTDGHEERADSRRPLGPRAADLYARIRTPRTRTSPIRPATFRRPCSGRPPCGRARGASRPSRRPVRGTILRSGRNRRLGGTREDVTRAPSAQSPRARAAVRRAAGGPRSGRVVCYGAPAGRRGRDHGLGVPGRWILLGRLTGRRGTPCLAGAGESPRASLGTVGRLGSRAGRALPAPRAASGAPGGVVTVHVVGEVKDPSGGPPSAPRSPGLLTRSRPPEGLRPGP
ncbi:hypothetical protein QJS66_03785 [Kocuria rhizophila]|nr:hypothetical protein QJS66_03785 [Kocuria rhizophila]